MINRFKCIYFNVLHTDKRLNTLYIDEQHAVNRF